MDIRDLFRKLLDEEMTSSVATNAIGTGNIATIDPLMKIVSRYERKRRSYNPTLVPTEGKTGPIQIPSDNAVKNSLNNGNKGTEQSPLKLLKDNPAVTAKRGVVNRAASGAKGRKSLLDTIKGK